MSANNKTSFITENEKSNNWTSLTSNIEDTIEEIWVTEQIQKIINNNNFSEFDKQNKKREIIKKFLPIKPSREEDFKNELRKNPDFIFNFWVSDFDNIWYLWGILEEFEGTVDVKKFCTIFEREIKNHIRKKNKDFFNENENLKVISKHMDINEEIFFGTAELSIWVRIKYYEMLPNSFLLEKQDQILENMMLDFFNTSINRNDLSNWFKLLIKKWFTSTKILDFILLHKHTQSIISIVEKFISLELFSTSEIIESLNNHEEYIIEQLEHPILEINTKVLKLLCHNVKIKCSIIEWVKNYIISEPIWYYTLKGIIRLYWSQTDLTCALTEWHRNGFHSQGQSSYSITPEFCELLQLPGIDLEVFTNEMIKSKDYISVAQIVANTWNIINHSKLKITNEDKTEISKQFCRHAMTFNSNIKELEEYEKNGIFSIVSKNEAVKRLFTNYFKCNNDFNISFRCWELENIIKYAKKQNFEISNMVQERLSRIDNQSFNRVMDILLKNNIVSKENISQQFKKLLENKLQNFLSNGQLDTHCLTKLSKAIDVNRILKEHFVEILEKNDSRTLSLIIKYNFWWENIDLELDDSHFDLVTSFYNESTRKSIDELETDSNFFWKYFDQNKLVSTYINRLEKVDIVTKCSLMTKAIEKWIVQLEELKKYFKFDQHAITYINKQLGTNSNVEQNYSWAKFVRNLLTIYKDYFDIEEIQPHLNSPEIRYNLVKTLNRSTFNSESAQILNKYIDFEKTIEEIIQWELQSIWDGLPDILEKTWLLNNIYYKAKKNIFNFLEIWIHDNLLFLNHFKDLDDKNCTQLLNLVVIPIFNQVHDLRDLNILLWYFDINKHIDENWEEEITSFKKFELIARSHKYNLSIPWEASPYWKNTLETLVNAPWINVKFLRELINQKFPNKELLIDDEPYIHPDSNTNFIEDKDNFSNSDINNLFAEYQNEFDKTWKSHRFGTLNITSSQYSKFFNILAELSSCTIVEEFEEIEDGDEYIDHHKGSKLKIIYQQEEHTIDKEEFSSITWFWFERFLIKYDFKINREKVYDTNNYYSKGFTQRLINIIDWVDAIDDKQMIPAFSETFSIDKIHQIVFNAIWIFTFNQDTVKYSKLFKGNKNFIALTDFFKSINEEQKKELLDSKEQNIEQYPDRKDYYIAEYNKRINHDTVLNFTNWWNVKWINYNNALDLMLEWEKLQNIKNIISSLLLDKDARKIILNTLKEIDKKIDKVQQNNELSHFQSLSWIHSILEHIDENNLEETFSKIEWQEIILASLLIYLGYNNLTRQNQSGKIKKEIDTVLKEYKNVDKKPNLLSYIDWELQISNVDTDRIINILKKYNFYKKVHSIKVEVAKKSDPRWWVSGNHTNCCMPLESWKNQDYILREDTAYFIISLIDEYEQESIIAQSVLVAANSDNSENFDTLAIDNIEVANNAIKYNSHLEAAYCYLKDRFNNKKIIIWTTHNDDGWVITWNTQLVQLNEHPLKGELTYSDCFWNDSAYLYHSNETDSNKYKNYWLTKYTLNQTVLKDYITKERFQTIQKLLEKIWAWENDWEWWLIFPDNYSRIITKDQEVLGYAVAADYLTDDYEEDYFVIEDFTFISNLSDKEKSQIFESYLEENALWNKFYAIKIKNQAIESLPTIKKFKVSKVKKDYTILKKN